METFTQRTTTVHRKTNETNIQLFLNIDGSGKYQLQSGIGFLDHILSHVAVHGLFDLELQAEGDLQVDVHHTVEDIALCLGQAFDQALGERRGIVRTASLFMPMDEALVLVAVDFSGRPYAIFEGEWHSPQVGGIPSTLFAHFFHSFSVTARCNLHAHILYGQDDHHQAEALFKGLGRVLDGATQREQRRPLQIPSTKGGLV